jgi:GT2 family glycosyltransferase
MSVVVPTRHRNGQLATCLERLSPAAQSLGADLYEVIVTDDGEASTAEALVAARFPWAQWTAGPRRGPAANRNHGASLARGQWLAFTDDDCLPSPGWLAAYAAEVARGGATVLEGRTTCAAGIHSILDEAPINTTGGNLWSCNMMIARPAFQAVGVFDERFPHAAVEDMEFHSRVKRAALPTRFVPEAVVDHPPRPRRRGVAAGQVWEGRMLLAAIEPNTLPNVLPVHVAKVRIKQVLTAGLSADAARFAWSSLVEMAVVTARWRGWVAKYAGAKPIGGKA